MAVPTDTLTRCPLFASLDRAHLARLAGVCRERAYATGAMLFREGDPAEGFFIVTAGAVRVFKIAPDGRERTLHVIYPPHAFAEVAVFDARGYPAFASALSSARAVLVPRRPFLAMLDEEPGAARQLIQSLSQWMHRLLDQLEAEAFLNARARVATWLLRELERQGGGAGTGSVRLAQSRKDLALQLGVAPETLSRIQTELEERGTIRAGRRQIDILDRDGLRDAILGQGG
jgi:CRP/FNR family transcriptional regulator